MDDLANKYLVEAGAIGLRRVPKEHLRRIAKASGAKVITTFANEETGESFDVSSLGEAEVFIIYIYKLGSIWRSYWW